MSDRLSAAEYRKLQGVPPPGADHVRFRTESEFQSAIVRWWDALIIEDGCYLLHVPNGGKRDRVTAAILKTMGVRPGVADLGIMMPRGRMAWIELKIGDGKPSAVQREFSSVCERLGHTYGVVRSFPEMVWTLAVLDVCYSEPPAARLIRG